MYNSYRKKIMDKNIFSIPISYYHNLFIVFDISTTECLFYIELIVFLYLKYLFFSIELSSKKTNPVLKIGCILYLMAYWIFLCSKKHK